MAACLACDQNIGANVSGGEGKQFQTLTSDTGRPLIREKNSENEVISKWPA